MFFVEIMPTLHLQDFFNYCVLKDFAMRSLKIVEEDNAGKDVIEKYKIKEGRKWDERYNMLYT